MNQSCSKNVLCYWHPQTFVWKINFWSYENVYSPQQYKTSKMLVFTWGQSCRLRRYVFYFETFHQTILISRLNFDDEIAAQKILSDAMTVAEMRADESQTRKERKRSKKLMFIMEEPTASQLCKALYLLHNFAKTCLWPIFSFHTPWKHQKSKQEVQNGISN